LADEEATEFFSNSLISNVAIVYGNCTEMPVIADEFEFLFLSRKNIFQIGIFLFVYKTFIASREIILVIRK
jgi:hypothetical protein